MKVYNLTCHLDHRFEGWFASEADALEQQENGLLICPICESKEITRLPSAPRISKGVVEKAPVSSDLSAAVVDGNSMVLSAPEQAKLQAQVQATVMKAMRELINKTEDVGDNFAEEARKIHYREAPERSIRGHATQDETAELREEGIEVVALPILPALKDTLQ
ncbi:DUF1178 family protein [Polynucleobacter sp. MWH-Spelu-300-X4]|uniref:DUF1178 family protein n=1 Tax=Polynucleobacter sp. MWH-Spelu-300-X4 TaxID=2689109 RepID=UPI001BFD76F5|nr:DUF1178 family protein [Polynucleobacter sp. MWH-Spelu-300-X4]QWD79296.1 DUF1178 family protein [Polynucleobacter sp. MWH-Spelu-300-X4]